MNNQILTLAFFIFAILVASGICWVRIARIEWTRLNHKKSAKEQYSDKFKPLL